jgi:hypothetical protein
MAFMQLSAQPTSAPSCKLCAAFAASGLPTARERGLAGSDTFNANPDICDACLHCDYILKRRMTFERGFGISVGLFLAVIAAALMAAARHGPKFAFLGSLSLFQRKLATFCLLLLISALPCMLIAFIVVKAAFGIHMQAGQANSAKELSESRQAEADRYFWLAQWASNKGNEQFRRRMQSQFDELRVANPSSLPTPRIGDVT